MTNRKDDTTPPTAQVLHTDRLEDEQRPHEPIRGKVVPGSSPCPTCMFCVSAGVGKWTGILGKSPDVPKDDFPIAYLEAVYYDDYGDNAKELGRQHLNIGSGQPDAVVSGKSTIVGAKKIWLYWKNKKGERRGPGTVQACDQ